MENKTLPSTFESLLLIAEFLAGIVGAIWLLLIGEYWIVIGGVAAALFIQYLFASLTLPATLSERYLLKAIGEQRQLKTFLIAFAISFYLNFIFLLWIFAVFASFAVKQNNAPLLPLMLFAYTVAMSPLTYFLMGEPNVNTKRSLIFGEAEFLILLGLFLFNVPPSFQVIILLAILILFSLIITIIGKLEMKNTTIS